MTLGDGTSWDLRLVMGWDGLDGADDGSGVRTCSDSCTRLNAERLGKSLKCTQVRIALCSLPQPSRPTVAFYYRTAGINLVP